LPDIEPSEDQQIIPPISDIAFIPTTDTESETTGEIDLSDDELAKIPGRDKIYGRSMLATFSYGMVDPFLTTIAYDMGATGSQMGWLRALSNLLGTFVQPLFGYLSDKVRRRTIFIALSNILYSSIWILLLFVNSIGSWIFPLNYFFPIIIGLIAGIASAIVIFTFKEKKARERAQKISRLLLEKDQKGKLGKVQQKEEPCIMGSSIVADKDPQQIARNGIETLCVSEEKTKEEIQYAQTKNGKIQVQPTTTDRLSAMLKNKNFMRFTFIFGIQSFFMSMCWPLFPIRQRGDINANFLEIAIFSVIMSTATLATVRYAGQVSDLIGRKPQMFLNRLILTAMPLGYMFVSQTWHIILMHAIICIPLGLNSSVMQAYLIDVTPERDRSMYIGFYNMFYGIILFLGSLFGGYLVDFLMGNVAIAGYTPGFPQYTAVTIAFAVGFVGRVITAIPFLTLKESKKFPYSIKDLPRLVRKSRKLVPLIMAVSFYFGVILILVGIKANLP